MAKAQKSPDDLLTTTEAGVELGIKRNRVMDLIRGGRLQAKKMGPMWTIRRADLDAVRDRPTGVHLTNWREKTVQPKPNAAKKKPKRS